MLAHNRVRYETKKGMHTLFSRENYSNLILTSLLVQKVLNTFQFSCTGSDTDATMVKFIISDSM